MTSLQEWILKRIGSMFLTDEERRKLWDLPEGVKIREFARIVPHGKWRENLNIGKNVYIGEGVILDCSEKLIIGEGTQISAFCQIYTHSTALEATLRGDRIEKPVHIGKNTWIGPGCIVYPGVKIGDRVMVLPNSVVNRDLPDDTVWGGVPVKEVEL